jgi:hypothetical protein
MKKQKYPFLHFMASCLKMGYNTQNQCQPSFSAKDHCVHKFRRISEVKLELSHGNYSIYRAKMDISVSSFWHNILTSKPSYLHFYSLSNWFYPTADQTQNLPFLSWAHWLLHHQSWILFQLNSPTWYP